MRALAIAAVATAAVGGAAVAALPVIDHSHVQTVATTIDPAELYNAAQKKFASGDVTGGLDGIRQTLAVAPADGDALALQAIWSEQAEDATTRDAALRRLGLVNPKLAATARAVISGVTAGAAIVPDTTPKDVRGKVAVVVLGFGLGKNGTMAAELVNRVTAGRAQAQATPTLPIVVSGGVPRAGITEAAAMQKWLVSNGVEANRIVAEGKSGSTVANAQNTAEILGAKGINDIVLITSPSHIRRAAADFGATGLRIVGTVTTATELDKYATPLKLSQQKGIRLEATRTARIPATHQVGVAVPDPLPDPGPGIIGEYVGPLLQQLLGSGSATEESP
ncbi:YdcF family protein [Gordonia soli]|uniref:DUF218 domain-containing protein n=1 Tax=Gordonia soli NBRC 108243 TaxID=1223545 RepID=M0QFH3_9ACTN|nr:YdcF family protein [Gordonia soli]GAC67056.1 hypothetical protein GS4_05_02690 [Gordonia soli NBRC 108243]